MISVKCVSHKDAMFKSFKISVPKSDLDKMFDEAMWPDGVRVRKFISPRKGFAHAPPQTEKGGRPDDTISER